MAYIVNACSGKIHTEECTFAKRMMKKRLITVQTISEARVIMKNIGKKPVLCSRCHIDKEVQRELDT